MILSSDQTRVYMLYKIIDYTTFRTFALVQEAILPYRSCIGKSQVIRI